MRIRAHHLFTALALGAVMSLGGAAAATASSSQGHDGRESRDGRISVETYNVNLGANLATLFGTVTRDAAITPATAAWREVKDNNFPARAKALAKVIASTHPDVIGLQEVALWELGHTKATDLTGADVSYKQVKYDYLALLLNALDARGVRYVVAEVNANFVGEAPLSATRWVRYTDRNVILVRKGSGLRFSEPTPGGGVYAAAIPGIPIAGNVKPVTRGWAAIDVMLGGQSVRVFDTHLEAYSNPVRAGQAIELVGKVAAANKPVIVVGDMNSRPVGCSTDAGLVQAYAIITAAGLQDVWPAVHPQEPCAGFTSDTDNKWPASLDHRIDHIFFSRGFTALDTWVVGNVPSVRTPSGLWPSDHASSVAVLTLTSMHDR